MEEDTGIIMAREEDTRTRTEVPGLPRRWEIPFIVLDRCLKYESLFVPKDGSTVIEPGSSRESHDGEASEPRVFQHPEWMMGIVLILGVMVIFAGLGNPIWWLIGSPFLLALAVWIYGRLRSLC
jgi:hypothetical protein